MTRPPRVFISSTLRDLAEHRRATIDTCLSLGVVPIAVEDFGASTDTPEAAIAHELEAADIFIGIIGFRYGYVPPDSDRSILELEYQSATARGIPRLMFLRSEHDPVPMAEVDTGEAAARLRAFKQQLQEELVVDNFSSPGELASKVRNSILQLPLMKRTESTAPPQRDEQRKIIVHPYVAPGVFINRQEEVAQLHDWISDTASPVALICGVGGIGKTALAWKLFEEDAFPQPFNGRFWWSFYEEPDFNAFLDKAASFLDPAVSAADSIVRRNEITQINHILDTLCSDRYLLVLDGIERLLATHSTESGGAETIGATYRLRRFGLRTIGAFFQRLLTVSKSKILTTSRIVPLELESASGTVLPGCRLISVQALSAQATVELLASYGVTGSGEFLDNAAAVAGHHPLAARLLAGQIVDSSTSTQLSPDEFTQSRLSETIDLALNRLSEESLLVLTSIAEESDPLPYELLAAKIQDANVKLSSPSRLDRVLTDLEDRALVSWDRSQNTYRVHRVVQLAVMRRKAPIPNGTNPIA